MSAAGSHPHLRRALVGGYRVADVEVALASLELTLSQLKLELEATRKRLAVAEARAADERDRTEHARRIEVEAAERVLLVEREHADRARDAHRRLEEAEAEAAKHREAAEEVRRLRDRLAGAIRELAVDLDGPTPEPPTRARAAAGSAQFGTEVELDAGPFVDLGSLNAFETALASLPSVGEVYVRGFEDGRATIDLTLRAAGPLLAEMAERLPYSLEVESHDAAHISMTVQPAPLPA
jgi:hypothetical protein